MALLSPIFLKLFLERESVYIIHYKKKGDRATVAPLGNNSVYRAAPLKNSGAALVIIRYIGRRHKIYMYYLLLNI